MNMPYAEFDIKLQEKLNETDDDTQILDYLQNELYHWELNNKRLPDDKALSVVDYLEKSKEHFQESLDEYSDQLVIFSDDEIVVGMYNMYSYYVTKVNYLLEIANQ